MTRVASLVVLAVLTLANAGTLPGCRSQREPAEAPPTLQSETTSGPVRLRVTADADRIGVADRLSVRVHAVWEPGATIESLDLPLADTGWRLASRTDSPVSIRSDGRLERAATFTLEPDLPGPYPVPGASVAWRLGADQRGVATVAPMTVAVTGVLDESADLLAVPGLRQTPPPPAPPHRSSAVLWIILAVGGAAVLLELGVVALWLRRRLARAGHGPVRDRIERLESLARDPDASPAALCDSAADVLRLLSRRRPTPELADISRRLEVVRFAPGAPEPSAARSLAGHVLDLLRPTNNRVPGAGGGA